MTSINFLSPSLLKAYVSFKSDADDMDADQLEKMHKEMGMNEDGEATPKQKVEKYILEQSVNMSEEIKKEIEEMKKLQQKLTALGQTAEGNKLQTELDQKNELVNKQAQNEADFIDSLSKKDLTNVLKQVISDDSVGADDSNIDLIAQLTNMIAEKGSATTVETKA